MNKSKRKRIHAICVLIDVQMDEEIQDLADIPDPIENSEACDQYRQNITLMKQAKHSLLTATRKHGLLTDG